MYLTPQNILLIGSLLLFISVWVSQGSYKFGVPALILFLGVGMLAGSEGVGAWFGHHQGIVFDNPKTAQFIGVVALNFILFSGGLDTKWRSIRPVLWQGVALSTVGVVLTAGAVGLFIYLALDNFSFAEAMLLGSIISSTDAAAVFSILRSSRLALKHNLKPMLELESGSNDPVAYLLTIMFISVIQNPTDSLWKLLPLFLMQILIGAMAGYLMGRVSVWIVNRIKTHYNGLYPVLMVALMFFTYSIADVLQGNGFLAIYIAAVFIGNKKIVQKELILGTFDGFAWLMQVVLFLSLGLLVHPIQVWSVLGIGMLISVFMIVVARPL
ncbi:MAG: potassium/proton antiporter, partial [Bacteroidales bacterium]|nr:potassium/proton antiporter [Bacteroidales bacterium]